MRTLSEPISLQKIFDAAVTAFLVEDRPFARAHLGGCDYVNSQGHRCAVGLCLPIEPSDYVIRADRLYYRDPDLEDALGNSFSVVARAYPAWFDSTVNSRSDESLDDFQRLLHDNWARSRPANRYGELTADLQADMRNAYRAVANSYGLILPANFPTE